MCRTLTRGNSAWLACFTFILIHGESYICFADLDVHADNPAKNKQICPCYQRIKLLNIVFLFIFTENERVEVCWFRLFLHFFKDSVHHCFCRNFLQFSDLSTLVEHFGVGKLLLMVLECVVHLWVNIVLVHDFHLLDVIQHEFIHCVSVVTEFIHSMPVRQWNRLVLILLYE